MKTKLILVFIFAAMLCVLTGCVAAGGMAAAIAAASSPPTDAADAPIKAPVRESAAASSLPTDVPESAAPVLPSGQLSGENAFRNGSYHRSSEQADTGFLEIKEMTDKDFAFTLEAIRYNPTTDNANTGAVAGTAETDGQTAVFRDSESATVLIFALSDRGIRIEQNEKANWFAGMGVTFTGEYALVRDPED